jgi:hypothetical protein
MFGICGAGGRHRRHFALRELREGFMSRNRAYVFVMGLITGVVVAALAAVQWNRTPQGCEPVIDVEYKRVGRDYVPDTVIRQPVRDAGRCILSEVGA